VATLGDFIEDGKWVCTKCGACCRIVGVAVPELDRGDGACRHLTEENLCGIYEKRPLLCRRLIDIDDRRMAAACADVYELAYGQPRSLDAGLWDSGLGLGPNTS
jgi:Fe-S-cluster containining protein